MRYAHRQSLLFLKTLYDFVDGGFRYQPLR